MSDRTKHLIGFVLAVALGAVSAFVQWHPELTAAASVVIALLTDLDKAFSAGQPPAGALLLVVGLALGVGACAHARPFLGCEETAAVKDVESEVVVALAQPDWRARLVDLAAKFSKDTVDCAVAAFLSGAQSQQGDVRVARAHEWLGR